KPERVRAVFLEDVVRVYHVAAGLGHFLPIFAEDEALINEFEKRLGGRDVAEVEQNLVPESRVEEVQDGVLRAADVEVNAGGCSVGAARRFVGPQARRYTHPVTFSSTTDKRGGIFRVKITEIIPARAGPLGHGVRLAGRAVGQVDPILRA